MYISLNRSHPFWSYKGTLPHITYCYMHTAWHIYFIFIVQLHYYEPFQQQQSFYNFLCPVISSLYRVDILSTFSQTSLKHVIPSMSEVTFHIHKNERNIWFIDGWNIPLQVVLHMQWVTKWRFLSLKTAQNPFSRVKFCLTRTHWYTGRQYWIQSVFIWPRKCTSSSLYWTG